MKKVIQISFVLLSILITTSACSFNKTNNENNDNSDNTGSGDPIIIEHKKGTTTLDKPAKRVVALEWIFSEELVALGIQPVGNADNAEYKIWVTDEVALADDVIDVGLRWEPDLETIASSEPDLIISNTDNNDAIYKQLNDIAPTIEFDRYPDEGGAYTGMVNDFKTIATAVGKTEEADQVLADLNKHYEEAKEKLAAEGKEKFN